MTNKEKAREIAEKNACDYPFKGNLINTSRAECEYSAIEMAEWKDQQFKEYLEKKVEEQREIIDSSRAFNIGAVLTRDVYQEIIDELFEED